MICPKCRKKYPDSTDVCPDCNVGLIGFLGDADAPEDSDPKGKMEKVVVDEGDSFSPVVYRTEPDESNTFNNKKNPALVLIVIGLLLLAAGVFCFVKGIDFSPEVTAQYIQSFSYVIVQK